MSLAVVVATHGFFQRPRERYVVEKASVSERESPAPPPRFRESGVQATGGVLVEFLHRHARHDYERIAVCQKRHIVWSQRSCGNRHRSAAHVTQTTHHAATNRRGIARIDCGFLCCMALELSPKVIHPRIHTTPKIIVHCKVEGGIREGGVPTVHC